MPDTIEIPTTILYTPRSDEPIDARLQLDEEIAIRNGDLSTEIDLSKVFDVRVGSPPKAAAGVFADTVLTIGFDGAEGREVLFVDASESVLDNIAGLLYRQLLHDVEVAVSHPVKIGGRVTGKSFEIGNLLVTPGKVGCSGINRSFSIELETIVDFSRSAETLLNERRPVIDIRYVKQGIAVSLKLSLTPTRKHQLLGRFLRRDYDKIKGHLGKIELPKPAFHALVKLYSLRGTANPGSLLRNTSASTAAILRGLTKADLVEMSDEQVALTPRGWILVTEYVENRDSSPDVGL